MTLTRLTRTLFLGFQVTAIVAVIAATSFFAWRAWDQQRERQAMEAAFQTMTIPNPGPLVERLGQPKHSFSFPLGPLTTRSTEPDDSRDVEISMDIYPGKYHWYCLVSHVRFVRFQNGQVGSLFVGFDSYRVEKPVVPYNAQTERGHEQPSRIPQGVEVNPSHWAYAADFVDVLCGRAPPYVRLNFEQIHSVWIPEYQRATQ
jgi:hypothetical protein